MHQYVLMIHTSQELFSAFGSSDFCRWAVETAAALRRGQTEAVDLETIAEELEELGRTEQRELRNRLKQLLVHLPKWTHQPEKRSVSWWASVNEPAA